MDIKKGKNEHSKVNFYWGSNELQIRSCFSIKVLKLNIFHDFVYHFRFVQ